MQCNTIDTFDDAVSLTHNTHSLDTRTRHTQNGSKTDSREYLDGFKAGQKVAYERLYWRRILVLFGGLAMVLGFFGYKGYAVNDVLDLDLSMSRADSVNDNPLVSPLSKPKKNVIFMVTDGMGPASVSLARTYRQYVQGLAYNNTLTIDKHFIGSSRTRSSDSPSLTLPLVPPPSPVVPSPTTEQSPSPPTTRPVAVFSKLPSDKVSRPDWW